VLAAGCEQPFTPKAPFVSKPVVTCIVTGTNAGFSISATVGRTYNVNGLDPIVNTTDPFDTSALPIITMNGDKDTLHLRHTRRTDTTRYTTPVYSFSNSGTLPYFSNGILSLAVTMGDGKKVSATSTVPRPRLIETSYMFVAGVTAFTTDPVWTLNWDNEQRDDHLYFPKLTLAYQIVGDSSTVSKTLEIPMHYVNTGGKMVPVYPTFTRALQLDYDFSALQTAIASISAGDSVKSRYKIGMLTFTLVEYDINLSDYYSSSHGYLDQYSVRVDETTYSNINGGIGIFGSQFINSLPFEMNSRFIKSFGYQM
jgi:hypothetical protein